MGQPVSGCTIERLDGKLVARFDDVCWSEPTRVTTWYALSADRSLGNVEALEGVPCESDRYGILRANGDAVASSVQGWRLRDIRAGLLGAEKNPPIKGERYPIACPKVRGNIQTRWHQGRWEKLMAKGWVTL